LKRFEFSQRVTSALEEMKESGFFKQESVLLSGQGSRIRLAGSNGSIKQALNLCTNDYLGLASEPRVISAACAAAQRWGAGLASVRFICGTQALHKELEFEIADFLGYEDAILFGSCFDANGGVFEPLLEEQDAIVSDTLNHASIIDGIRLTGAKRYRFANGDMESLEAQLKAARSDGANAIFIATDGVFSMDGNTANLREIVALADKYEALILVDDSHATGHLGPGGVGTPAACEVPGRIDILTGTFGKALGGAMGGFICATREIVALLRQRARPYLFSNSLLPAACGAALEAIRIIRSNEGNILRLRLEANSKRFRSLMTDNGFRIRAGDTPIIPVMLGSARAAQEMSAQLINRGVYAVGFSYPVVPRGEARIRTQMTAALTSEDIAEAVEAFVLAREEIAHTA
jgi:glycine C-acetyltransferase